MKSFLPKEDPKQESFPLYILKPGLRLPVLGAGFKARDPSPTIQISNNPILKANLEGVARNIQLFNRLVEKTQKEEKKQDPEIMKSSTLEKKYLNDKLLILTDRKKQKKVTDIFASQIRPLEFQKISTNLLKAENKNVSNNSDIQELSARSFGEKRKVEPVSFSRVRKDHGEMNESREGFMKRENYHLAFKPRYRSVPKGSSITYQNMANNFRHENRIKKQFDDVNLFDSARSHQQTDFLSKDMGGEEAIFDSQINIEKTNVPKSFRMESPFKTRVVREFAQLKSSQIFSVRKNENYSGLLNQVFREDQNIPASNTDLPIYFKLLPANQIFLEKKNMKSRSNYSFSSRAGQTPNKALKQNQDTVFFCSNFCQDPEQSFFGVCDGHGTNGHLVSSFIKENLSKHIEIQWKNSKNTDLPISEIIKKGFMSMIYQVENSQINTQMSGSTAVTVQIKGNRLWCANVGDSRAILGRSRNEKGWEAQPLSIDHKPDHPTENDRIKKAGGRVAPCKNLKGESQGPNRVWLQNEPTPGLAVARSIGDLVAKKAGVIADPEIQEFELSKDDMFIVVASDGVWEFLSNDKVIQIIIPYFLKGDLDGACDAVIKKAVEAWQTFSESIDDITCIIVSLQNKG